MAQPSAGAESPQRSGATLCHAAPRLSPPLSNLPPQIAQQILARQGGPSSEPRARPGPVVSPPADCGRGPHHLERQPPPLFLRLDALSSPRRLAAIRPAIRSQQPADTGGGHFDATGLPLPVAAQGERGQLVGGEIMVPAERAAIAIYLSITRSRRVGMGFAIPSLYSTLMTFFECFIGSPATFPITPF